MTARERLRKGLTGWLRPGRFRRGKNRMLPENDLKASLFWICRGNPVRKALALLRIVALLDGSELPGRQPLELGRVDASLILLAVLADARAIKKTILRLDQIMKCDPSLLKRAKLVLRYCQHLLEGREEV